MSRSIYAVLLGRGIDLGGLIKEDHNDTNIDEIMSFQCLVRSIQSLMYPNVYFICLRLLAYTKLHKAIKK